MRGFEVHCVFFYQNSILQGSPVYDHAKYALIFFQVTESYTINIMLNRRHYWWFLLQYLWPNFDHSTVTCHTECTFARVTHSIRGVLLQNLGLTSRIIGKNQTCIKWYGRRKGNIQQVNLTIIYIYIIVIFFCINECSQSNKALI